MTAPLIPPPPPDPGLADFLARLFGADLDRLEAALRTECARGNGIWIDPEPRPGTSPSTHLFEIGAFGLWANGMTAPEAVRAWRTRARFATETDLEATE